MSIAQDLASVKQRIEEAAERAHRDPKSVRLLGASKTKSAEQISQAVESGLDLIGENKLQEATEKFPHIPPVEKHFIGHLQKNKVKDVVAVFDCIESVDTVKIAKEIDKQCQKIGKTMPVLLEINIGQEETKHGFNPDDVEIYYLEVSKLKSIVVEGLMCIPPQGRDPRPFFRRMRELKECLELRILSMGMSSDYEIAVEEGADIVRVGTSIFGKRL